jgi:hypothetical protein
MLSTTTARTNHGAGGPIAPTRRRRRKRRTAELRQRARGSAPDRDVRDQRSRREFDGDARRCREPGDESLSPLF